MGFDGEDLDRSKGGPCSGACVRGLWKGGRCGMCCTLVVEWGVGHVSHVGVWVGGGGMCDMFVEVRGVWRKTLVAE